MATCGAREHVVTFRRRQSRFAQVGGVRPAQQRVRWCARSRPAPGSGDRTRQRQSRRRVAPIRRPVPDLRPYGDPLAAFEYFTVAIRNYHNPGNAANLRPILSFLAAILDRPGRYKSAATVIRQVMRDLGPPPDVRHLA